METKEVLVRCACGWETTGSIKKVVAATQEHGRRIHNMLPTRDQVLSMVVKVAEAVPRDRSAPS